MMKIASAALAGGLYLTTAVAFASTDLHAILKPWEQSVALPWTGNPIVAIDTPTYGELQDFSAQGELVYELAAASEFWSVGRDRAIVTTEDATGLRSHHRIEIFAGVLPNQHAAHDFESGNPLPTEIDPQGQLSVGPQGALYGSSGARIALDASGTAAYFEIPLPSPQQAFPPEASDPADSGCADLRIGLGGGGGGDVGPGVWEDCVASLGGDGCNVTLLSAHDDGGAALFRVEARFTASSTALRGVVEGSGGAAPTPWIDLDRDGHSLRLDWWTGGLRLWLDGRAVAQMKTAATETSAAALRVGAVGAPAGTNATYSLDNVRVFTRGSSGGHLAIADDSFEGDLSAWTATGTSSGGALTVTPAAALGGDSGLAIDLGSGWGEWLVQADPNNAVSAGLGFRIDPDGLELPSGEILTIAHGRRADVDAPGNRFSLRLWHSAGGVKVQATGLDDDGTPRRTPYSPALSPGSRVDLRWQRAVEAASADGWMRLWVNGALVGEVLDLDNHDFGLESLRLGALALKPNVGGTLVIDEFDLWSPLLP